MGGVHLEKYNIASLYPRSYRSGWADRMSPCHKVIYGVDSVRYLTNGLDTNLNRHCTHISRIHIFVLKALLCRIRFLSDIPRIGLRR